MEAEARYTWVGAAVLGLLAALVAALLWLQGAGREGDFQRFGIDFQEQALDGLDVGGAVLLRGIKVGRVESVALAPEVPNRVRVEVRVDARTPVHANTAAIVTRNFVTGIAAVTLVTSEPSGPRLTAVPRGERMPMIAEGRSDVQELTGRVNQVGERASLALNNFNQLINEENRETVAAMLRNLRELSAGLSARLDALDQTLALAGRAAGDIARAADRLGGAGERIAGVVERGGERFDHTLVEADATLAQARQTLQQAGAATEALHAQAGRTAGLVEDAVLRIDDQLGAALVELRLSLEATTRVVDRLRDPRAALLGPGEAQLGPGEARP